MAQLFSLGTLKDNTTNLNGFNQSKIDIIQDLYNDYKNGLLDDEVKYKEKFNQVFFGELLGYENRIHRIPEGHIKGVGNADIILGNFVDGKEEAENIQIACELKGAKSNLVKKQYGHGGLSPVGQGFSYKTGLKNCKWLIVSNFFETRLYRDNQTDFEIWNLETLLDPKDDYFNLRSLYLLLHKDNLLADNGTSKTEDLLSHFRDEQLEITKKFYKEYKQLRLELLQDVSKRNPSLSVNTLVEKGQKIIDRLIFIFFCEDRGLLPDKKLKEGIERAGEFDISPRDMTKRFFKGVDQGSVKLEIPDGYNGGLFKEDAILNSLNVGDNICRKFVELTNYDFHDDLSVNVLGHIFEQSISDLEEIKEDLIGKESKVLQESKGRRKKDGIFYTPEYIVDYIVQNSVMKYLNEKEDECLKKHINKKNGEILAYQEYQHILQHIKVLDPACGSGAFLVRVFDVLFEENKRVGSILNSLFDDTQAYKNILTNNIYGVDLNDESVEITKLSLWLKSAQKGKKLNNLDSNIKCGNSLIDDSEIAGDKAFDWNVEFKEIMDDGGFDVIVGNPPYVFARGNFDEKEKDFFIKIYKSAQYQINTYFLFMELCVTLSKNKGYFGLIVPNSWLMISSGSGLRKYLLETTSFLEIINLLGSTFDDANVETIVMINQKGYVPKNIIKIFNNDTGYINFIHEKKQDDYLKSKNNALYLFSDDQQYKIIEKIKKGSSDLNDLVLIKAGLKAYESGKGTPKQTSIDVKSRPFDYTYKYNENTYKYLDGKDVQRYNINRSGTYLEYGDHLAAPRNFDLFDKNKIIVREITGKYPRSLVSTYTNEIYLFNMSNICIKQNNKDINLKYILSLLGSSLISYYFIQNTAKSVRKLFPKIILVDLRKFPIKETSLSEQQPFIEKADKMLSLNKEFHKKIDMILKYLQQKYGLEKISKKLQKFYELDFKDFVKQLKIKNISMEEERELMQLFEKDKAEVLVLKEEIDSTDREIDEMVFELYGLNTEERKVILGE